MRKNQSGFGAFGIVLLVLLVAVIGFAGWRIHEAKQQDKADLAAEKTTVTAKPKTAQTKTDPVVSAKSASLKSDEERTDMGDSYLYTNKTIGFSFTYPKNTNWIPDGKATYIDKASSFIFNNRGYYSPTYFDSTNNEWYTKNDDGTRVSVPISTDTSKPDFKVTKDGHTVYDLLGNGDNYCGAHWVIISVKGYLAQFFAGACDDAAKNDESVSTSPDAYYYSDYLKALDGLLKSIKFE